MGEPALRRATYQDVLDAPDGMTAEILGGELHLSPRPASEHGHVEHELAFDLESALRGGGRAPVGWWILREPELHLGKVDPTCVVAVPDLAGWRHERMPKIPRVAAFTLPPDWVCEILSPGWVNARRDKVEKPADYAMAGIPWFWLVDPLERILEVRSLRDGVYAAVQTFGGDDRVRALPFEAVELDLARWWLPE